MLLSTLDHTAVCRKISIYDITDNRLNMLFIVFQVKEVCIGCAHTPSTMG